MEFIFYVFFFGGFMAIVWLFISFAINLTKIRAGELKPLALLLPQLKQDALSCIYDVTAELDDMKTSYCRTDLWVFYQIVKSCPHNYWHCLTFVRDRADVRVYQSRKQNGGFNDGNARNVAAFFTRMLKIQPNRVTLMLPPEPLLSGRRPKMCFNLNESEQAEFVSTPVEVSTDIGALFKTAKRHPPNVKRIHKLEECHPIPCSACQQKANQAVH